MISLEWGQHRKARVWLNELPSATFVPATTRERVVAISASTALVTRRSAIEVFVPHGAMASYGLLGVEVETADSSRLLVKVGLSDVPGAPFQESLAGTLDDVRVGLTEEYADAVLDGATRAFIGDERGCGGVASFYCAAQGQIGSNARTFAALATVLAHLPWLTADQREGSQLAELLRSSFNY